MKTQLTVRALPNPHLFFLSTLLFFCFSNSIFGQAQLTTFELAVKLDTLYSNSQKEDGGEDAQAFFNAIRSRYNWGNIEYDIVKEYFYENIYLYDKMKVVHDELVAKGIAGKDRRALLEEQKEKLEDEVFEFAQKLCEEEQERFQARTSTDTTCAYKKITRNFAPQFESEVNIIKMIEEISNAIKVDTSFSKEKKADTREWLREFSRKISDKKRELIELKDEANRLSAAAGAGSGLALSGSSDLGLDGPAPIIIQTPGGTSLESSLIDAASKWIAERMREELSMAFFERFETWLAGKNISVLFPNTFSALKTSVTTDYALMIQIFRSAFEKDLEQLPFQMADYLMLELGYKENVKTVEGLYLKSWFEIQELDSVILVENKTMEKIYFELNALSIKMDSLYGLIDYQADEINVQLEQAINSLDSEIAICNTKLYNRQFLLDSLYIKVNNKRNHFYGNEELAGDAFKTLRYILLTTKALKILSEGKHPTNLMSFMRGNVDELLPDAGNIKPALVILDEVSKSLIKTSAEGKTAWLSRKDQKMLREQPQLLSFFFGLLAEDIRQSLIKEYNEISNMRENTINTLQLNGELPAAATNLPESVSYDADYMLDALFEKIQTSGIGQIGPTVDTFYMNISNFYGIEISTDAKGYIKYYLQETYDTLAQNKTFMTAYQEYRGATMGYLNYLPEFRDTAQAIFDEHGLSHAGEDLEYFIDIEKDDWLYQLNLWDEETLRNYKNLDSLKNAFVPYIISNLSSFTTDSTAVKKLQGISREYIEKDFALMETNRHFDIVSSEIKDEAIAVLTEPIRSYEYEQYAKAVSSRPEIVKIDLKLNKAFSNLEFARRLLMDDQRNLLTIVGNFLNLADRIDQLKIQFDELRKKENAAIGPQEKIYMLQNSLEALEQVFRIALKKDDPTLQTVSGLSRNVLDAYTAVLEKDYDAIVMNVMYISDSILELSYQQKTKGLLDEIESRKNAKEILRKNVHYNDLKRKEKKELKTIYEELKQLKTKSEAELNYETILAEKERKQQRMQEIFRYGAFLAAVVEANNSDEIKTAIRAIALPAGSYNIKRRNKFNISLNAYPGITGGAEQAFTTTNDKWAGNLGFTAPVGLAISWGYTSKIDEPRYLFDKSYADRIDKYPIVRGDRFPNGHSGSVYFSLIDLGAVVLYRFDNETDPLPSDIGFQQIFSPGVAYAHGFRGVPISVMVGGSLSPQLRKINETGANSFRLNASVVVDLPMANFHTKKRYRKN